MASWRRWFFAILLSSAFMANTAESRCGGSIGQECNNPSYNPECYKLNGNRWCQTDGYWDVVGPDLWVWRLYTPVSVYNHTQWPAAADAWRAWNYPPNGPTNGLVFFTDSDSRYVHDVDIYTVWDAGDWGGFASVDAAGGCYLRGSGFIQINSRTMINDYTYQVHLFEHELGHSFGLGHMCDCPYIMNPCFFQCPSALTYCDGAGAAALYPFDRF